MAEYQQIKDGFGVTITTVIKRIADSAFIPNDPTNRDWVEYQAWLALGNVPMEAE